MKILLVQPSSEKQRISPFLLTETCPEPLGICFVGEYLMNAGHTVKLIHQLNQEDGYVVNAAKEFKPDLIGFSTVTSTRTATFRLAKGIKSLMPDVKTIVGGYDSLDYAGILEEPNIDFVVIGEGEETFLELAEALEKRDCPTSIKGIAYRNEIGEASLTEKRGRITNIDELIPTKTRLQLPYEKYFSNKIGESGKRFGTIYTSRGCPFQCTFCCTPELYGNKIVFRSPNTVLDEIMFLHKTFGIEHIKFRDEEPTINKKRINNLCELLKETNLPVTFRSFARSSDISFELIKNMKDAGWTGLFIGFEACSNHELTYLKKGHTIKDTIRAFELAHEAGMYTTGSAIIGFPEQTIDDAIKINDFLKIIQPDMIYIGIYTPFPGTKLFREYENKGIIRSRNWDDFDCETPVLKTRIPPKDLSWLRLEIYRRYHNSEEWKKQAQENLNKGGYAAETYAHYINFLQESRGILIYL